MIMILQFTSINFPYNKHFHQMKAITKLIQPFSLLTKVPKTIKVQQEPKTWLSKLFTSNENSATYVLLKQLFDYLENNPLIKKQFPYLKNTQRVEQNCMVLHVHLLRDRIKQEAGLPRSQLQKYVYNLQSQFFPDFAGKVNTAIPTQQFREHYAEAYLNKLELFTELIKQHEWGLSSNRKAITPQQYSPLLKRILYENRVGETHVELLKFSQYYVAHKKYLDMLQWNDMVNYKVKWGLESMKYLNQAEQFNKTTTKK